MLSANGTNPRPALVKKQRWGGLETCPGVDLNKREAIVAPKTRILQSYEFSGRCRTNNCRPGHGLVLLP